MTDRHVDHEPHEPPMQGYEAETADVRGIAWAGVAVALLVIATAGGAHLWVGQSADEPTTGIAVEVEEGAIRPVSTRAPVTADQPDMLRRLREKHEAMLSSYGWVDRSQGVARIPIDRAIEIFVDEGSVELPRAGAGTSTPPPSQVSRPELPRAGAGTEGGEPRSVGADLEQAKEQAAQEDEQ